MTRKNTICLRILALAFVCLFVFSSCNLSFVVKESETTSRETTAVIVVDPEELSPFDVFATEVALEFYGEQPYWWNSTAIDASSLGYVRSSDLKAEYWVYSRDLWTTEAEETVSFCDEKLQILYSYDYTSLTDNQKYVYDSLEYQLIMNRKAYDGKNTWKILTLPSFINKYGGEVAEFASMIENYNLRNEQDIIDVLDYVASTTEAFASYITYGQDRIKEGFPLSDLTLKDMKEYLSNVIEVGENFYLIDYIKKKINDCSFLTEEQATTYASSFENKMMTYFLPAVGTLYENLDSLMGRWTNVTESAYTHYGEAAEGYYEWKLAYTLGLKEVNLELYSTKMYNEYVKAYMEYYQLAQEISQKSSNFQQEYEARLASSTSFLGCANVEEIVALLKKTSSFIVSPLEEEPQISIKFVDETEAENAGYLAYYTLSPLDEKNSPVESITLNPAGYTALSDCLFTLGHEGYPGHLYSIVARKQSGLPAVCTILSCLGAEEGWAQYAAYSVLMQYSQNTTDEVDSYIVQMLATMLYVNYMFSAYLDVLVNGMGTTVADLAAMGMTQAEALDSIRRVDEIPGEMGAYGYGFSQMLYYHECVSSQCTKGTVQEYNAYILSHNGLLGIANLEKVTNAYIMDHS